MPAMHLDSGGGGALDSAQLDAARLAHASPLFADYSRAAGAYNNTPRADAKLSQAAAPSSGSDTRKSNTTASDGQKHSFGGVPQIFNPLARHG